MPRDRAKRGKHAHDVDPIEVREPKNVRPPSEPTPRRAPPTAEASEDE